MSQEADGVTVTLYDRLRGDEFVVRARYVVGADGARSSVVEQVGLPIAGRSEVGGSMNIVFTADLSNHVAHRPSVLYWALRPGAHLGGIGMGLIRMVRPWNEWLLTWGYDIDQANNPAEWVGGDSVCRSRSEGASSGAFGECVQCAKHLWCARGAVAGAVVIPNSY
jgi:2-polyprenyl-6-methoxyphenol hydroxylase-like FAD-dependent oxidoreductase